LTASSSTIDDDQAFNALAIQYDAVYNDTIVKIRGQPCTSWTFNWDAQGPNRTVIMWVTPAQGSQIPVEMDTAYENGFFSYDDVTLDADYSEFLAYKTLCTIDTQPCLSP